MRVAVGRDVYKIAHYLSPAREAYWRRARHAKKRLKNCRLCLMRLRLPIRQALALYTLHCKRRPFSIGKAKAGAVVVAELKFREVTL